MYSTTLSGPTSNRSPNQATTYGNDKASVAASRSLNSAAYQVLSRGWMDGQHRDSLTGATAMNTSTFYTITWKLRPVDQVIPAGLRLGLVLTLSDAEFVSSHSTGATVTVDLAGSGLKLPLAPGAGLAAPSSPRTAPPIVNDDFKNHTDNRPARRASERRSSVEEVFNARASSHC